jgi:hypothetical protein
MRSYNHLPQKTIKSYSSISFLSWDIISSAVDPAGSPSGGDVRHMHDGVLQPVTVERLAAGTASSSSAFAIATALRPPTWRIPL